GRSSVPYRVSSADAGVVIAASVNVTAVRRREPGFLTAYGCGAGRDAATVNHGAGTPVANGAIVGVTAELTSCVWSHAPGDVVVDLLGWWVR
ncbi:MAG: hypothetical protein ACLGHQ_05490, partial [Acidimicrobiia bacterium]